MTPVALEWIVRFRRYLSSERRLSAHTDQSYARDPLERDGSHKPRASAAALTAQCVAHQLREACEELGAHPRMKAVAVRAAEREEPE